jgi:hypothetical protein
MGALFVTGIAIGLSIPAISAQQREGAGGRRGPRPPTMEELRAGSGDAPAADSDQPPTIMMDVQWHWTTSGSPASGGTGRSRSTTSTRRGHIQQLVRKNPTIRNNVEQKDVT